MISFQGVFSPQNYSRTPHSCSILEIILQCLSDSESLMSSSPAPATSGILYMFANTVPLLRYDWSATDHSQEFKLIKLHINTTAGQDTLHVSSLLLVSKASEKCDQGRRMNPNDKKSLKQFLDDFGSSFDHNWGSDLACDIHLTSICL